MTQNTQTVSTWQRVERLMDAMLTVEHSEPYPHEDGTMGGEYSDYVYDEDHKFRNLIAAEIDALTAERDDVRDAYAAQGAILAAARMEIESLKANVSGWQVKAGDAGNKLVRSEQEAQRLTRMRDFERDAAGTMADQYSILAEERNALKAEVERLRPAAEAWRSLPEDVQIDAEVAAAARARAAKEGTEQ